MFRGTYQVTLDSKQRVSVPVAFRPMLLDGDGEKVVLTRHFEPCLLAYPASEYEKVVEVLNAKPPFSRQANRLRRMLIAHAFELNLDRQGRILVPQLLRDYAGFNSELMIAGVGERFEVWSVERWKDRERIDTEPDAAEELQQDLNDFGLA